MFNFFYSNFCYINKKLILEFKEKILILKIPVFRNVYFLAE